MNETDIRLDTNIFRKLNLDKIDMKSVYLGHAKELTLTKHKKMASTSTDIISS